MTIKKILNQTFPSPDKNWSTTIFFMSLFVSLFLLVFQPINGDIPYKEIILAGYGLLSYITGAILHLFCLNIFPQYFNENKWTIKKHYYWFAIQFFFIGITNHIYSLYVLPFYQGGLEGLLSFELRAFSLGVFPVTIQVVITYNYLLTNNLKEITELNKRISFPINPDKNEEPICLKADNNKDVLELPITKLYFIESVGNYIQVYYNHKGSITSTILRCSLKKAELVINNHPSIIKCHRAYLVNMQHVSNVKGNSQGYKLIMQQADKEIPVARNYSKLIKEQLELIHRN
jgi:DNA-binding LytR/AlgR family response regulator